MNEELKTKANELLLRLLEGVEEGSEFLAGEIPELLEQLLAWKFAISLIPSVGLILCCLLAVAGVLTIAASNESEKEHPVRMAGAAACFVIGLFFGIGCLANLNGDWVQIWIAPKVYLLEYAAEVVK